MRNNLVIFIVIWSPFLDILLCADAEASAYTYSHACTAIEMHRGRFSEESQAYREIDRLLSDRCRNYDWNRAGAADAVFPGSPGSVDEVLRRTPPANADTASRTPEVSTQEANAAQMYEECKMRAVRQQGDCMIEIQNVAQRNIDAYRVLSSRLALSADGPSLENACLGISSYESSAQSAIQIAIGACQNHRQECLSSCAQADRAFRQEIDISPSIQKWITVDKQVAASSCSVIDQYISEARSQPSAQARDLSSQCAAARQRLNEDEQAMDKNLMKQVGQALQMLSQDLAKPQMPLPTEGPLQRSYGMSSENIQPLESSFVNIGKGPSQSPNSIPENSVLPSGRAAPADYKASGRKLMKAPNGTASSLGNFRSKGPVVQSDSRKNQRVGSMEILNGYYGDPSGYSRRPSGAGLFDSSDQSSGRNSRLVGNLPHKGSSTDLTQFMPVGGRLRRIPLSTGPDGITGPHTDLFKKVRIRYESTFVNFD